MHSEESVIRDFIFEGRVIVCLVSENIVVEYRIRDGFLIREMYCAFFVRDMLGVRFFVVWVRSTARVRVRVKVRIYVYV